MAKAITRVKRTNYYPFSESAQKIILLFVVGGIILRHNDARRTMTPPHGIGGSIVRGPSVTPQSSFFVKKLVVESQSADCVIVYFIRIGEICGL